MPNTRPNHLPSRREALKGVAAFGLLPFATPERNPIEDTAISKASSPIGNPFSFCLNTSTIMGQELGIRKEIETAAEAGYDGIEVWIRSLETYAKEGGSLSDLQSLAEDLGIRIENAIGFAPWIVEDNDIRSAGLDQAKREMDMLAEVGCKRIAAPPAGATKQGGLDLDRAAERFRSLMDLGVDRGVIPQLEIWGFSKNLYRLSQVLYVAAECGHPQTKILPDVYHLYKGGSDFDGLKLLNGHAIDIFHMNDYPAEPGRETVGDKDRVYPGDGVAPIASILKDLQSADSPIILSLELFNREYWKQDPLEVAKTGLRKMQEAVEG